MSHRFTTKSQTSYIRNIIISLVVFLVIFLLFWMELTSIQKRVNEEGIQTLQTAVTRSVTRCYAEEGSYPESLDYLKEHYGLHYDESKYFVDYQPIGSNIMPDITIMRKGGN